MEAIMKFSFTGRHMEIGDTLKTSATQACTGLAKKFGLEFLETNIVIKKDNYRFCTDISIKTASGDSYFATNEVNDPKISFETTLHKIELQIQKKKKQHTCKCSCKNMQDNINMQYESDVTEEETGPMIIAEIVDDLPIISVSEATEQLDETNSIFVFKNVSDNAVNVVYLRKDKNFGWIDYKKK